MGGGNIPTNTANGVQSLAVNTTGYFNTANGFHALFSNTTGYSNTANGTSSLSGNTLGLYNTAGGHQSLFSNTIGNNNTANGFQSLKANTGSFNTALGSSSLTNNTSGINNTASGYQTLASNTTGDNNTATGFQSMGTNGIGASNTANGYQSLGNNTLGANNTAIGNQALLSNTTGNNNTAIGNLALGTNTTGTNNTAIGYGADIASAALTNATAIGNGAIVSTSNTMQLGNTSITSIKTSAKYTGSGFATPTGTNAQFLMADGTTSTASSPGVPYTGANAPVDLNAQNLVNINNAGIGTATPDASAKLDVTSTSQGFLPPRMTTTQQDAINSPVQGLIIYNTTLKSVQVYNGTAWFSTVHFIGESYGGGIVFYVYDNGQHGLVAATADQNGGAAIRWYGGSNTDTRARADGVGAGLKNTAIIIANQGSNDGNAFAATVCNEYSVTVAGVTYGDWYLPSKDELNLLFINRVAVGGFASEYYWSSSEFDGVNAWYQDFVNGGQVGNGKGGAARVRAVRAF